MGTPRLSIIIPVYNAEKYLEACIDSILSQDFRDFEVILVNDGSTDASEKICEDFAKKDLRIRTFHKKNGGVSSARNLGLDHALGEWLYFVDADDSLTRGFLNVMETLSPNAQVVQFGYNRVEGNIIFPIAPLKNEEFISADDFLTKGTFKGMSLWIHFIKTSIVTENKLRFTIGLKYAEDLEFVIKCYAFSAKIVSLTDIGYNYYLRELSTMSKAFTFENAKVHLEVADNLLEFFRINKLSFGPFFQSRMEYMIKSYFSFSLNIKRQNFNKYLFRSTFEEFLGKHRNSKVFNSVFKSGSMMLMRFNPLFYRRLMGLRRK